MPDSVAKTTVADPHQQLPAAIVIDEISLIGSRCGPFDKAIDVGGLVTNRYRLDQAREAFEKQRGPTRSTLSFQLMRIDKAWDGRFLSAKLDFLRRIVFVRRLELSPPGP
ncbi:hypothetical protein [Roseiconus lacunae]|uniref:hypothetical protein n=1 Tax=Roseiconus lacunae TaxID=2605694 RepID=UPI001356D0DC|nr:hypothetical protein [Roseiconus lacunae]